MNEVLAEIGKVPRHITIDANKIATDIGSRKSANMVILGAASPFLGLEYDKLEQSVEKLFSRKGSDVVNVNLNALRQGRSHAAKFIHN